MRKSDAGAVLLSPLGVREALMRRHVRLGWLTMAAVLAAGSCKDDVGLTSLPETYIAVLNGANEPTAITTAAQGLATIVVKGNVLSYRVELSNIDSAFLAHIHNGPAGVNGGVMRNLYVPPKPATDLKFSGTLIEDTTTVVDSVLTHMRNGTAYVNVHTEVNKGGEIRGTVFRLQ